MERESTVAALNSEHATYNHKHIALAEQTRTITTLPSYINNQLFLGTIRKLQAALGLVFVSFKSFYNTAGALANSACYIASPRC